MPFKFTLSPLDGDKAVFKGPVGSAKLELKLTNDTDAKAAWKVKCTCNNTFKISPAVGVVGAGESATCTIESKVSEKPSRQHYLFVSHIPADGDKAARSVWSDNKGNPEEKRISVEFQPDEAAGEKKEDAPAEEKKEEKKDDEKKDEEKKEEKEEEKKEEEKKGEKEEKKEE